MGEIGMLEDTKKDRVVAITSYCNTEEKINVLIENISLIRSKFPDYKIALHANYPLDVHIQELVDMYFYEDLNYIDNKNSLILWNKLSYFNKKFLQVLPDPGFSVFQQIKTLTKFLIDYNWVMLINYDTSVEEIKIDDYTEDYDLTLHIFPRMKGYSLIMMFFNPQVFFEKVASKLTFKNWNRIEGRNKIAEEKFYDLVQESDIKYYAHQSPPPSDKIRGDSDYLKPNAPSNPYFTNYLLYQNEDVLEIYLWGLNRKIISMVVTDNNGGFYVITNQNNKGGFESEVHTYGWEFDSIHVDSIDGVTVNVDLKIKKGYTTQPI